MTVRRFAIVFLLAQAVGAAAWWGLLLGWPASRLPFKAADARDVILLVFGVADILLFAGTSAVCGCGFAAGRHWAWPTLCIHSGEAGYAGLYCWTLFALTGDGALGATLMTPSLTVPAWLVWRLRPTRGTP